jgi:hypothetical protein
LSHTCSETGQKGNLSSPKDKLGNCLKTLRVKSILQAPDPLTDHSEPKEKVTAQTLVPNESVRQGSTQDPSFPAIQGSGSVGPLTLTAVLFAIVRAHPVAVIPAVSQDTA